jgi:DNA-binding response OmpR family regulator
MEDSNRQKIVIVEDNEALADIYKTRMELKGYDCQVANDGLSGLNLIQKVMPDLVLLDLMVPVMAGDQILSLMRNSQWGKDIKVYIISNLNESDAPSGLRDKGIEGYAVKANMHDDDLDNIVDEVLKPKDQTENIVLE